MKRNKQIDEYLDMSRDMKKAKKHLVIPNGIETVSGFSNNSIIESVCFSDTVFEISDNAFARCENLTTINNYEHIKKVACSAFASTKWLEENKDEFVIIGDTLLKYNGNKTDIHIPSGIRYIGDKAFSHSNVENLYLNDSVYEIGYYSFKNCEKLKKVYLTEGGNLRKVGTGAFYGCENLEDIEFLSKALIKYDSLENTLFSRKSGDFLIINDILVRYQGQKKVVTVPENVKEIGPYAFYKNELIEVIFPESLKVIGEKAFYGCEFLEKISLPEGLSIIEKETFYNCKHLEQIEIPESVRVIGSRAFSRCNWINKVNFKGSISVIDDHAFSFCESLRKIVFPDSPISFGKGVFFHCKNLEKVILPSVFLSRGSVGFVPMEMFCGCESLEDINLKTSLLHIGYSTFAGCIKLDPHKIIKNINNVNNRILSRYFGEDY